MITHQKHLAQSGRSTQSAVDIFNTLRIFTKEPIREQEIKLECMNFQDMTLISNVKGLEEGQFFVIFLSSRPHTEQLRKVVKLVLHQSLHLKS